jgi:hypothetical protein
MVIVNGSEDYTESGFSRQVAASNGMKGTRAAVGFVISRKKGHPGCDGMPLLIV